MLYLTPPSHYGSNTPWPPGQVTPSSDTLSTKHPPPHRTKMCLRPTHPLRTISGTALSNHAHFSRYPSWRQCRWGLFTRGQSTLHDSRAAATWPRPQQRYRKDSWSFAYVKETVLPRRNVISALPPTSMVAVICPIIDCTSPRECETKEHILFGETSLQLTQMLAVPFTLMVLVMLSSLHSSRFLPDTTPALLIRMSMWPTSAFTCGF